MNLNALLIRAYILLTLDVQGGLSSAKNEVSTLLKFIINSIVVPLVALGLGAILVFNVAKAWKKHHGSQEPYGENITAIVIVVICLAVVLSAPTWLWQMVGA